MRKFKATAFNDNEETFVFFFFNENWHSINIVARRCLDKLVNEDVFHQKHGPWNFRNIDVAG